MAHDLERSELVAFAAMLDGAPGDGGGFGCVRVGEALCGMVRAWPDMPFFNRVCGAGADTDVGELLRVYDGLEHTVAVAPGSGGLERALRDAGYTPGYAWMKFACRADPDAEAATELRIAAVGPEDALDFAEPVLGGFGMPDLLRDRIAGLVGRPGWTCLVGYDGDTPVSAAALVVEGDQAWLGMGATLPEARGKGGQSALLAMRIRLAAEAGCTIVTTETGAREEGRPDRSYRNILRAGFEEAFERPNWVSPT